MNKMYAAGWLVAVVIGIFFIMHSIVAAANRVVVVPLGGQKCTSPAENSFTNSIGMTFNLIPAGTFTMGSPDDEPGGPYLDEQPEHQVTLTKSFYMQITEVTNGQWDEVITDAQSIWNQILPDIVNFNELSIKFSITCLNLIESPNTQQSKRGSI